MEIINGSQIAQEIRQKVKKRNEQEGISPCLAMILVGGQKEDLHYVGLKEKAAAATGGKSRLLHLPEDSSQQELMAKIAELNQDEQVDGILLQLPLPAALEEQTDEILAAIRPDKDVDGFSLVNRGRMSGDNPGFISCAALACLEIIERFFPSLAGKKAVLVGDSFDLIIPLATIMIKRACQLSVLPSYEPGQASGADILVVEKGRAGIVQAEGLAPGVLIIDAGFYWGAGGVCGNVDRAALEGQGFEARLLPVPGGMGPILIAKLMENLAQAARQKRY